MARNLRPNLDGRGSTQGIARIERAVEAQAVVYVFFNRGVKALEHVEGQL
jgi:hypothetical protein